MDCPECNKKMQNCIVGSVKVKECPSCNGTWFEEEQLRIAKEQIDPDLNWMDFELWKHPDKFKIMGNPISCPFCSAKMVSIDYRDTGIEIDYCQNCRGVWLGGKKFLQIITALTDELENMSSADYFRATLHEASQIFSGPESFISEWRDFITVIKLLEYRLLSANPKLQKLLADFQASNPIR